jgi:hypothetical protein
MKVKVVLMALAIGVVSLGCNLREAYLGLRADYSVFKGTIATQCANGEISQARCDLLAAADSRLRALDAVIHEGESSRKEIKAALQQLEAVVEQQKDALAGN